MNRSTDRVVLLYRISIVAVAVLCLLLIWLNEILNFATETADTLITLSCVLAFLIALDTVIWCWRVYFRNIMLRDGDVPRFEAILNKLGRLRSNTAMSYATFYYYSGAYQNAVDICHAVIGQKKRKKAAAYRYYAGACFEWGDVEALGRVCAEFTAFSQNAKRRDMKLYAPVMELYRLFANGEYEALKQQYAALEHHKYNNATKWTCAYVYAVTCYLLSDLDTAKVYFSAIATEAPLMNIGRLSARHLANIDEGKPYESVSVRVFPTEGYTLPSASKVPAVIRSLLCVLLILAISSVIFAHAMERLEQKRYEQAVAQYRERLINTLDRTYDGFTLVEYFNIEENGEILETVCVFQHADGTFEAGFYFQYVDSGMMDYQTIHTIDVNRKYYGASVEVGPCCNRYISFAIRNTEEEIPADRLHVTPVSANGETRYFCVTGID